MSIPIRDETEEIPLENFDLRRIRSNLDLYRYEISEVKAKELNANKRNATIKMLKKHLIETEQRCDQQLEKICGAKEEIKELNLDESKETLTEDETDSEEDEEDEEDEEKDQEEAIAIYEKPLELIKPDSDTQLAQLVDEE